MSFEGLDTADRAVAVIGVGAVLPDAPDAASFWKNVVQARYSISEVRDDRWSAADYWDPDPKVPGKTYSKIAGWVRDFKFDSLKFRIPPKVAAAMDEAQMWGIVSTREALADAGHPDRPLDLERTATILGNAMGGELHYHTTLKVSVPPTLRRKLFTSEAWLRLDGASRAELERVLLASADDLPSITEDSMPGELANVVAGRIAHVFDLHGPNYICDAACASSLAALDAAVEGLVSRAFDVAVCGGVDRNMSAGTFIKFAKIGALSPDGSRPFAKGANGFVMGEGAAIYVLKRLADAERAGDRIYAVIRGIGASSDGRGKGITAPNPEGQRRALVRAYERAGFPLSTVGLVEAHGTSTAVGDVAEVESLNAVYAGHGLPRNSVALGSIKSQIGHLKAAAGAAGMLKTILALHHKVLPPSAQFHEPNPGIRFDDGPLYVNTQARPWERPACGIRRAGVSAFGFGGTNFHVVVEEHVPGMLTSRRTQVQVPANPVSGGSGGAAAAQLREPPLLRGLVMASGATLAELKPQLEKLMADADAGKVPEKQLPSAECMRAQERIAIDFGSAKELKERCQKALDAIGDDRPAAWRLARGKGVFRGREAPGKIAFMFPGQGSQYVNMLRELRDVSATVREIFDEADEVMKSRLEGRLLTQLIFVDDADPARLEKAEEALRHTTVTQPAMLAADIALARLLGDYGIEPDMVMGHSLGEYAALVAAGVMPFADALVAVSARAREMANVSLADSGKMAGVIGPYEKIERVLGEVKGYVVAANRNSRKQTVIAGSSVGVDEASEKLREAGLKVIPLNVSHAFHSEIVAPASEPLRRVIEGLHIAPPKVPVIANVDGEPYPSDPQARPAIIDRLARQIAAPVLFTAGLETLYREGVRVFVEVGPKKVLASFAEECLGDKEDIVALATNNPKTGPEASFGAALAYLYSIGRGRPKTEPAPRPVPEVRTAEPPTSESVIATAPLPPKPVATVPRETKPAAALPVSAPGSPQIVHDGDTLVPPVSSAAPGGPVDAATTMELGKLFAEFLDKGMRVFRDAQPPTGAQRAEVVLAPAQDTRDPYASQGSVVVSGAGIGLPGSGHRLFDDEGFDRILRGEQMIGPVPQAQRERMLDKNVVRLVKSEKVSPTLELISDASEVLKLAGRRGEFSLVREYGIAEERASAYDITTEMAVAAGLEALRDAGIPLVRRYRRTSTGSFLPDRWMLPEPLADETGVIFASAFPGYNRFAELMGEYHAYKACLSRIEALRSARAAAGEAGAAIDALIEAEQKKLDASPYRFERKFLFEILAMGHSQFAELIGARGPNTQVNAACSSTTLAVATAEDWIRMGRCARVIVVAADDVTSDTMLEWIGAGFLATGAATTESDVTRAALPFDRRRHGMILGMGACALVVESEDAVRERGMRGIAEILATEAANSAFHGTRLDVSHICQVMDKMVGTAERRHGIDRKQIAPQTVFISHETYTPARGGSASAEVHALRQTFGERASDIVISNTKGFTGHPMGVGIEDALAVKILERRIVPPIPNFKEVDPELGQLNLSKGGSYPVEYGLRFSAGFGSQIAITLYRRIAGQGERVADAARYSDWLHAMSGYPGAATYVEHRTLRVRDEGVPPELPRRTSWQPGDVPRARVRGPSPAPSAAPMAASPAPTAAAAVARPPSTPPQAPARVDDLDQRVLKIVADKTGYPMDMLALDLDLEADLGIDTVKQAEVFAEIRTTFGLPRKDDLRLRDYPTLGHVIGYVRSGMGLPEAAAAAPAATSTSAAASGADDLGARVLQIVADKTGYPMDMLALDLDLEADLGIDTVKQAEVFAEIRTTFGLPRKDDLRLRDYPTLGHVIGYVRSGLGLPEGAGAASAPISATAATAPGAPPVAGAAPAGVDDVARKVLGIVSEKTGYPVDMLALDLDLEADLGIDTVKQAEVFAAMRSTFDLPRRDDLRLRDYPTLAHVIGYVRAGRPDLAPAPAPVAGPPAAAAPAAPAAEAAKPAVATGDDDVMRIVLEIVAEKTGYPVDMLAPDLDLEADLGVDTVKQAEVFAVVRERFDIPRVTDLKLRDYPTLGHVVGFVKANRKDAKESPASSDKQPVTAAGREGSGQASARRLVPAPMVRGPLSLGKPTGVQVGASSTVVLVADQGEVGAKLEGLLVSRGARVLRIGEVAAGDDLVERIRGWAEGKPVDGVFFLSSLDAETSLDEQTAEEFRARLDKGVRALYRLARGLYEDLGRAGAFLVTATRMGGTLGYGSVPSAAPVSGAVSGFTKAMAREREAALVKVVDFEADADADFVATTLVEEVERDGGAVEVSHRGGLRFGTTLLEDRLPAGHGKGPIVLGSDSVFLVTGAGGAITSAIAADLASASHGVFHLLDLPPEPNRANPDLERFHKDREGLKLEVLDRLRKASTDRVTPVMVERELQRIEREAVTLNAIRAVEQAGATAHYHSCDVTDTEAVAKVVGAILEKYGRVDVIVHAAGLERSRPLDVKDEREFNLVFDVKAIGLYNLLAATRGAKVATVVSFSSVAGRFGNAGQTDYSAANDFLCKTTSALRALRPETRAIVIDWTAWGSIGMATRGSIPEIMKRAGIEMLEPAYGIPVVRDEIQRGRRGEIVVAGALGMLVARKEATGGVEPGAQVATPDAGPFAMTLASADPYEGIVLKLELDPKEPYLDHHRIDGIPVMPGVMGVEAFAQAAMAVAPGMKIVAMKDVTFEAPLKCYRDEKRQAELTVRLVDTVHGLRAHCVLSSTWPVASPGRPAEPKRHFAATVVLGEASELGKRESPAGLDNGGVVGRDALYRAYFHGDSFRVLDKTEVGKSGRTIVGRLAQPLPPLGLRAYRTQTAPRLLELCFQTAGVVEIGSTRKLGLPARIEELRVAETATDGAPASAEVSVAQSSDGLTFDAVVCDADGGVQLVMTGYHTSAMPSGMADDVWKPLSDGLSGYRA